jgi:ARD/ARD' family
MVRAWFMDDDVDSDQRLEHHRNPPDFVDLTKLFELTGVEHFKVSRKSSISAPAEPKVCGWEISLRKSRLQMTF